MMFGSDSTSHPLQLPLLPSNGLDVVVVVVVSGTAVVVVVVVGAEVVVVVVVSGAEVVVVVVAGSPPLPSDGGAYCAAGFLILLVE